MEGGLFSLIDSHMVLGVAIPMVAMLVFFVHEFGHYFAARMCQVHIENVTIGLGREVLARKDSRGTLWSFRIFPVCGFVHIEEKTKEGGGNAMFHYQPLWKRFLIVAAGPLSNLILAFFLFMLFYMAAGQPAVPPYITGVEIGSPAEEAGFRPGDRIVTVNGKPARRFDDVYESTLKVTGQPVSFILERDGQTIRTSATAVGVTYTDQMGYERSHGRIGALAIHQPWELRAVVSINGLETGGNVGRARDLLLDRMGRDIIIGMKAVDGKVHNYTVNISAAANSELANPGSEDYERVYLGRTRHNFYLPLGIGGSIREALSDSSRLIYGIANVAGRIGRMDRSLIEPEVRVARDVSPWKHSMFIVIYVGTIISVSIAFMNVLPIPGFDGNMLLRYVVELALGPGRAELVAPYVCRAALLFLIGVLMLINREMLALFMK